MRGSAVQIRSPAPANSLEINDLKGNFGSAENRTRMHEMAPKCGFSWLQNGYRFGRFSALNPPPSQPVPGFPCHPLPPSTSHTRLHGARASRKARQVHPPQPSRASILPSSVARIIRNRALPPLISAQSAPICRSSSASIQRSSPFTSTTRLRPSGNRARKSG
jgi:hypothetical protein